MKPRILQVVLDMQYVGEKVVSALSRALSDEFEIYFCCLDSIGLLGKEIQKDGYFITSLNRSPGLDYSLPYKIAKLTKEKQIDIIQAHHYTPYFYSALSRFLYHKPRLIFTEHGRNYPDTVRLARKSINLLLNLVTDRVTAVCEFTKNGLIQNEKIPESKIVVIYNGIEGFKDSQLIPDDSHKKIFSWLAGSDKVLGFLARLEWIKNPELLLDSFALTLKRVPDAKLLVMGKGYMRSTLEDRCRQLGILDKVMFTGLLKNPLPVISHLRALVVTSLSEAASLSILEAMMCGIPVIATNVGGNPELVKHEKTGYLFASRDKYGCADAMAKILTDKNRALELGNTAKKYAASKFSFESMVTQYKKLYHEIL